MNFAFLVAAHTDAKQVERMVKCLLEVGDVYVHIDAKTEDGSVMERLNEVKKHLSDKTQLSVYQRVKVYWGGTRRLVGRSCCCKRQ